MWNTKNVWNRTPIRALVLLAAVGGISLNAGARGYVDGVTPNGKGGFNVKFSPSAQSTATFSNTATGVAVTAPVAVALSPSVIIQTMATGAIGGAAAGGAMGAAIGAIGAVGIAAIPALYDMMTRAGTRVAPDGSFEKKDPSVCTVAPCTAYYPVNFTTGGSDTSVKYSSAAAACAKTAANGTAWSANYNFTVVTSTNSLCTVALTAKSNGSFVQNSNYAQAQGQVAAYPVSYIPATSEEVVAAISANAPTQAEVQALVDGLFYPEMAPPSVTGPARQFMGNTVELLSPNERKLVEEWKNMDYSTPGEIKVQTEKKTTITSDPRTETTTTTNSDGTTAVSTKQIPAQTKTETTYDTDEQPKEDPCKAYPNRVGCMDADVPEGEIPKSTKTITFQEENVFGSGSCPANLTASVGTLGKTVTVWDWSKTCQMSLPLRAMVLLLSTFAAFLIVMPGSTRT